MQDFTKALLSITDWVRRNPETFNIIGKGLGIIAEQALKASSRVFAFGLDLAKIIGNTVEVEKATGAWNQELGRSSQQQMRMADAAGIFNRALNDNENAAGGATKELSKLYDVIKDKLTDALSTAKDELESAQEAFTDFGTNVAEGIKNAFSFTDAKDAGDETGKGFLAGLTDQVAGVKEYSTNVDLLLSRGLSLDALKAVLDAGGQAGAAIAAELVAGGQEAITGPNGVNALVATVKEVADKLGLDTASRFYQAGVDQGTALVAGLESVLAKYEKILANPNLSTKRLNSLLEQAQTDIAFTQITAGQTIATPAPTQSSIKSVGEAKAARSSSAPITVNVNGGMATSAEIGRVVADSLKAFTRQNGPLEVPTVGYR
jgi:hypothetical protein